MPAPIRLRILLRSIAPRQADPLALRLQIAYGQKYVRTYIYRHVRLARLPIGLATFPFLLSTTPSPLPYELSSSHFLL